ncbi:hypothetical protein MLB1_10250 [Mycobacteroides sp. LB1]|nr:hypothetical protein [Mycobacteroides sp. LB1]
MAAAVLGAGDAHAEPAALPSPDQLTKQLSVIFDNNASSAQRTSYLEGGNAALPVANLIGGPIAEHRSMVSLQVENPTFAGDHLTSQLKMSVMGMGSQRRPLDWVERRGVWKLSNGSLCDIFNETARGNSCPL